MAIELSPLDIEILKALKTKINGLTRDVLCKSVGSPRTSVFDHLVKLMKYELVVGVKEYALRNAPLKTPQARPKVYFQIKKGLDVSNLITANKI